MSVGVGSGAGDVGTSVGVTVGLGPKLGEHNAEVLDMLRSRADRRGDQSLGPSSSAAEQPMRDGDRREQRTCPLES